MRSRFAERIKYSGFFLSVLILTHIPLSSAFAQLIKAKSLPPPPKPAGFSVVGENIITSIEELPGLLTGIAYMFALGFGLKSIIKIKDHVENPMKYPLKDAGVLLLAGGALFALPIIYEAMFTSMGATAVATGSAQVSRVAFNVEGAATTTSTTTSTTKAFK